MKHLALTSVVFALLGWVTLDSQASHRRGSCGGSEACGPAPCAPVAPQYVEQQVTRYKCVQKERDVQMVINRLVPREEKYTYTVMVPVTREVSRTETCYKPVHKQVEYTCTVMVPVTTQEKRTITRCQIVQKEVDATYTVMVPKTVQQKRTITYCELERRLQEVTVPVCRTIQVQCQDQCGNCYTACQRVVEYQKVTREVCVPIHKSKEVLVNVTVCEPQVRSCKKIVCHPVTTQTEVVCNVVRCVPQQQKMTRTVCEMVPETRQVVCNVTTCQAEQRTGTRTVYECRAETVTRKCFYNEMVPYTETIRVLVCNSCVSCGGGHRGCCR